MNVKIHFLFLFPESIAKFYYVYCFSLEDKIHVCRNEKLKACDIDLPKEHGFGCKSEIISLDYLQEMGAGACTGRGWFQPEEN